jgi:hypothetical protein
MGCLNCSDGLHWECVNVTDGDCCCKNKSEAPVAEEDDYDDDEPRYVSRTYKREGTLKDQQSTGRKRAAKLYPLNPDAPCEWQKLKFAGGGPKPIVGCIDGKQQARHHGPDKNTLNNDPGNVHRICHKCHNRWHTENDPLYEADSAAITNRHNPDTIATIDELVANLAYWATRSTVKAKDQ